MATNVIFDDYVLRTRTAILLGDPALSEVIEKWEQDDPLLVALGSVEFFKGRTKWSQLEPQHWRLLMTNTFNKRDTTLPIERRYNDEEPVVSTLLFLSMGLVHCLQLRAMGAVDTLRVMRLSEIDITLEFTVLMMSQPKRKPPSTGLQVVVDNT